MAPPPPNPPQKGIFSLHNECYFQLFVYICEKPASLAYQDRKQSQDKPVIALKT